jgi:hypothetical protein
MNNVSRPGRTLPVLLLIASFSVTLFSCGGGHGSDGEPPINEDSVRPHAISLKTAIRYTADFRNTVDSFTKKCPGLKDSFQMGYSEAFNSDVYRILLRQKDSLGRPAAGIRIYYGLSREDGKVRFVMVPYDVDGKDILKHLISTDEKPGPGKAEKKTESLQADGGAQALEMGQRCPPVCPPSGPLNP